MSVLIPPPNPNIKFTYEDYLLTPEDKRYELIEGDLLMTPSPATKHQRIVGDLFTDLRRFVREKKLGEVLIGPIDVYFSDHDVCVPDVVYVSRQRANIIKQKCIEGPPDLVIEVLSPSTKDRDLKTKKTLYARYGVAEYWIVNPDTKTIEVLTLTEQGYSTLQTCAPGLPLQSKVLEGLPLDPAALDIA